MVFPGSFKSTAESQLLIIRRDLFVERSRRLAVLEALYRPTPILESSTLESDIFSPRLIQRWYPSVKSSDRSDVYLGTLEGRPVALKGPRLYKIRRENAIELFVSEASVMSVRHTNILEFLGVLVVDEGPCNLGMYLIFPYLEHGTVMEYLAANPRDNRTLLLRDVLRAVSNLHARGYAHGGIMGSNVLISSSRRAVLTGFGQSRSLDSPATFTTIGYIPYQPPELLEDHLSDNYTGPTKPGDVYSTACFGYEMFTDCIPFHDISPCASPRTRVCQILVQVAMGRRLPLKPTAFAAAYTSNGLTEEIWSLLEEAWNHDFQRRPSVDDLLQRSVFAEVVDERPPVPANV
ncbi:hypothetical protein D9611_006331 [Ephemerocybe angulata]|uniref:Protein kinase domain-containing protein n=1 Tax=Ephemerocybe angulata TaxID=980116 RepID=A0A8H5FGR3_9AGAR|nr:hypothetical protein D9611_006331 [Tulosesus angulatus]